MEITAHAVTQENHQRIKLILPYFLGLSFFFLLMQTFINTSANQKNMMLILFGLNFIGFLSFRYIKPNQMLIWGYTLGILFWGVSYVLWLPSYILGHVTLTSLFYCLSFFIIYKGWDAIYLLAPGIIFVIMGLNSIGDLNLLYYIGIYISTGAICLLLTLMNWKLWKFSYLQKMEILEEDRILKHDYNMKSIENTQLVNQLENVLAFGNNIFENSFSDENTFLRYSFQKAINLCPIADYGSVFTITNGQVDFVMTIGHDYSALNALSIREELFKLPSEEVMVIRHIEHQLFNTSENQKLIKEFIVAVKPTKETLTFQINLGDQKSIGFCLDIATNSSSFFNHDDIRTMEAFKTIVKFYYINDRFINLQSHFKGDLIRSLTNFLELHDIYTKGHSIDVANYSKMIAEQMGFDPQNIEEIYWAGVLHDIGKLLIPNTILNKTEPLNSDEIKLIRTHPDLAANVLLENPELLNTARIIRAHHEHYDGNGYPQGLIADNIPIESRIIAIADSYEAMTANRPYKRKMTHLEAIDELLSCSGTQFDPDIVSHFVALLMIKEHAS
jgi:putative nucleotidyltransferase with HDIG domain